LYTYTCCHAHDAIGGSGLIRPLKDLLVTNVLDNQDEATRLIASYGWFTSLNNISRYSAGMIGLNKISLKCNRWEYRYRVASRFAGKLVPWTVERLTWPEHIAQALETDGPDLEPSSWYMSRGPVQVFYDPIPAPAPAKKTGWAALT